MPNFLVERHPTGIILGIAVADPDPQRRRGPGHPDPEIRGWGGGGPAGSSEFPFQQLTFCTLEIGTGKSFPVIINTTLHM